MFWLGIIGAGLLGSCAILVLTTLVCITFFKGCNNNYIAMHVSTVNDAVSIPLGLLGIGSLCFCLEQYLSIAKIFMVIALIYVANPIIGYIISKTIYLSNSSESEEIK